ncbi:WbqC family protein [Nitrospinota bacterium]
MIVSIHQPAYLPWLGHFHKIFLSDVFVFLDTVQLEKNGFVNRNRVRTHSGVQWLTLPVLMKGHMDKTIGEMKINPTVRWKEKHLRTIEQAYHTRPHYERYAKGIEDLIGDAGESLSDFLLEMLRFFLDALGMGDKRIVPASELNPEGKRSEMLLDICKKVGADVYLSGDGAKEYLDEAPFREAGIGVEFQGFQHPEYDQGAERFEPNLAVIDALFNLGGEAVIPMLRSARN